MPKPFNIERLRATLAASAVALFLVAPRAGAQPLPDVGDVTEALEKRDGFIPFYWDEDLGKVFLEIAAFEQDFLYLVGISSGLGSNDVGLDRGLLGAEHVVRFHRVGRRIFLIASNVHFRANSSNKLEERAVRDSFAESILAGFDIVAADDRSVLVDATDFVVRDAFGIRRWLAEGNHGDFEFRRELSAPDVSRSRSFRDNTELEALLTFESARPGPAVQGVAANPYAVTLRMRHSLIRLPELDGYRPRAFHPRSGFFPFMFQDYSAPVESDKTRRWITRHRLVRDGATTETGRVSEPIVYYLDSGVPEPIRSALLEGARWWEAAFDAAGFNGAFRVEMLPEDADPMDIRYNVIQWVHRSTRGWSFGASIVDPRTGEILKGHVRLGSLRVRQDYLLAQGLLSPFDSVFVSAPDSADPMLTMALARLKQLSAHEVGHTLGLAHNFAASGRGRASVMDYPAPLAGFDDAGRITLSDAYAVGVGEWDIMAIRYGYEQFPDTTSEAEGLGAVLDEMEELKLPYITDQDARPLGAAHPAANLWDNGADPLEAFDWEMDIRADALSRFGTSSIRPDDPMARLEDVLVPLYLRHRYQVEAVAKLLGGVTYAYTMREDQDSVPESVSPERQAAALDRLLWALRPEILRLPHAALTLIPPRPPGYPITREMFARYSSPTFDPYVPAEVASSMVLGAIAAPERASRLIAQHDFDPRMPGLNAVLDSTTNAIWQSDVGSDPYDSELRRVVQTVWADVLLELARNSRASDPVRARVVEHLRQLHGSLQLNAGSAGDVETIAHRALLADRIEKYLFRLFDPSEAVSRSETPPGSPIGSDLQLRDRMRHRSRLLDRYAPELGCSLDH